MVFTAISLVVMLGIASLVIDVGFDLGQRRFMQNGADAAALAAARMLGNNVSPYPANGTWPQGIAQFFSVPDATVYQAAYNVATSNQNVGITGRTTNFSVTLEYCVAANANSYSTASGCPSPNSWVTSTDSSGSHSVPDGTYKVRATVSSTISTIFGGVVGRSTISASAQAIAVIQGVAQPTTETGGIWPFTLWANQDFGTDPDTLYELWGSTAPSSPAAGSWQNVLDMTPASKWCDGSGVDYLWAGSTGSTPAPAAYPTTDGSQGNVTCSTFTPQGTSWNRTGYTADPRYPGTDTNSTDLANWAACTWGGTMQVGNKFPTYVDTKPSQTGNGGNNVAQGIYGSGVTTCPNGSTYFFQGYTQTDPAHPSWGPYRDVWVATWGNAEYWNKKLGQWSTTTNGTAPDRVQLMSILPFRIYENYSTQNSAVYGRVVSPVYPPGSNPPLAGTGPDIYGNVVSLGS